MRAWLLALTASFVVATSSAWGATLTDGCEAAQLAAVGDHARCHLQAISAGLRADRSPDTSSCLPKLLARLTGIDRRFGAACAVRDVGILDAHVRAHIDAISARLAPPPLTGSAAACAAAKMRQSGKLAACRAGLEAKALTRGTPPDVARCESGTRSVFMRADVQFGAACPTHADADVTLTESVRLTQTLRLNVVVIYLDDTRADALTTHMPPGMAPHLERLASEGIVFRNAFSPSPICAPSRASLLTGLRIQGGVRGGHGVRTLTSIGSFDDDITVATWFRAQSRQSGLFGKYVNAYMPPAFIVSGDRMYVPPGWTRWFAVRSNEYYGGLLGKSWYSVGDDGTQTEYRGCCGRSSITPGCFPNDPACIDDQTYQTDVLASELADFVAERSGIGWLAMLTPSASHGGHAVYPDPAARHLDTLADDIGLWRPPSFAQPIVDAAFHPPWNAAPLPTFPQPGLTDRQRRYALETLLAVDEAVGELFDTLEAEGILDRTAIVLASDNGVTWGEHAIWNQSKGCAYEECQRIPLIVRMPDGVGRVVDEPVLVTDLAPTIAALARVPVPAPTDGRSLEPLLRGATPSVPWRTDYCLEFEPHTPDWVSYRGVRDVAGGFTYVEYDNGGVELFDLTADPAQLVNVAGQPAYAAEQARLAARVTDVCR
jgi:arylsulfatase A-like enzyme